MIEALTIQFNDIMVRPSSLTRLHPGSDIPCAFHGGRRQVSFQTRHGCQSMVSSNDEPILSVEYVVIADLIAWKQKAKKNSMDSVEPQLMTINRR